MERFYETHLINQCDDLDAKARIGDDFHRMSASIKTDEGRSAGVTFRWTYMGRSDHGLQIEIQDGSFWAIPEFSSILSHLAAWGAAGKSATPDHVEMALIGLGFQFVDLAQPGHYVGDAEKRLRAI